MQQMKHDPDFWAVLVGMGASFMKAVKNKLNYKEIIFGVIIGGLLCLGTLGLLDLFLDGLNQRVVILITFAVGWTANSFTDVLDDFIKDGYEILRKWASNKFNKNDQKPNTNG